MKKYFIIIIAMLFSLMAGASEKKVSLSSPDVNGDGVVNAQDLVVLINYYLEKKDCPETKIVVLSDPHVMAPELLVSKGDAWTNYLNGQRKLVDYSQPLFDEMMAKIVNLILAGN